MPLRHGRVVERSGQADDDRVVRLVERDRIAAFRADDLGAVDQPLRPQEADGQFGLVAGRPHRDGDGDRIRVGAAARISSGASPTTLSPRISSVDPRTATIDRS